MTPDSSTTTQVDVTVKTRDQATGALIDAVSTSAKLTKADAGRSAGDKVEELIYISITPGNLPNYADANISINTSEKLTKADAG